MSTPDWHLIFKAFMSWDFHMLWTVSVLVCVISKYLQTNSVKIPLWWRWITSLCKMEWNFVISSKNIYVKNGFWYGIENEKNWNFHTLNILAPIFVQRLSNGCSLLTQDDETDISDQIFKTSEKSKSQIWPMQLGNQWKENKRIRK